MIKIKQLAHWSEDAALFASDNIYTAIYKVSASAHQNYTIKIRIPSLYFCIVSIQEELFTVCMRRKHTSVCMLVWGVFLENIYLGLIYSTLRSMYTLLETNL